MDGSSLDNIFMAFLKYCLTSITRNSNLTDKHEVDGALILLPTLHYCSVLRVFKGTLATENGKKSNKE